MMIRVQFNASDQRFKTSFHASEQGFAVGFEALQEVAIHKDADPYTGAYEVTPKSDAQVLPTARKLMAEDVVIGAIPREYGLVTYDNTRTITVR